MLYVCVKCFKDLNPVMSVIFAHKRYIFHTKRAGTHIN